jgi:hypothetical protein
MTDDKKLMKYFNRRLTDEELDIELHLNFSQSEKIEDLKFSRETPAPYIPPTYTSTVPSNYSTERAQEFLNKFQEVYLASDDDKYVIATVIRNLVYSPDLVDLTEDDLIDLADSISKL